MSAFASLVTAQVAAAVFGFLFWTVTARSLPANQIAVAHAAVSVMTFLGVLATLGYGTMLLVELPQTAEARRRSVLWHACMVVGCASVGCGLVWCLVARHLGPTLGAAVADPASAAVLILGGTLTATASVLDHAVIGLNRPGLQVGRNLLASVLKVPLCLLGVSLGFRSHLTVLLAWVIPLGASQLIVWRLARLRREAPIRDRLSEHLSRYFRQALANHGLNLSLSATSLCLPMLAAAVLPTAQYTPFSLAWLIASFVFTPAYMLAVALFANTAGDEAQFRAQMRRTLPLGLGLASVACLGADLLAAPVMSTFGPSYVERGALILRVLCIGGIALVVKDHLYVLYRVRGQTGRAALIGFAGVLTEFGAATFGGLTHGVVGLAVGWLCALLLQAVIGAIVLTSKLRHDGVALASTHWPWTARSTRQRV